MVWGQNFIVFDDYARYPILKGETTIYEEITYDKFFEAHTRAVEFSKIEDKRWTDKVKEWCNPAKAKIIP